MNKTRENKRTLTTSAIVLLLCIVALIGATAAWFTSTASNTGNRIQAGTLKVDLLMDKTAAAGGAAGDYTVISNGSGDIFKEAAVAENSNITLWEPGKTQVVYLAVKNSGSLALKYNIIVDVTDEGLVGSLEYAILNAKSDDSTMGVAKLSGKKWSDIVAAAGASNTGDVAAGRTVAAEGGVMDESAGETQYFALAVHMKETAGNEYQGKDAIIDVSVVATQLASENDGFGTNTYDAQADIVLPTEPVHAKVTTTTAVKSTTTGDINFTTSGVVKSAIVNGSALAALVDVDTATTSYSAVFNLNVDTTELASTSTTYEITLDKVLTTTKSGTSTTATSKVTETLSKWLTATIDVGAGLKDVSVTHSGQPMTALANTSADPSVDAGGYYYDSTTGILTIKAKSFSPFKVSFSIDADIAVSKPGETTKYMSLAAFRDSVNAGERDCYEGYTATVLRDIDATATDWVPIGMRIYGSSYNPYYGKFNGNNKTIKVKNSEITCCDYFGFFSEVWNGDSADTKRIYDLNLEVNFVASHTEMPYNVVAGLVSEVLGYVGIENVQVSGTIVSNRVAGGLIGNALSANSPYLGSFSIVNCSVCADVSAFAVNYPDNWLAVGGIIGQQGGKDCCTVRNCTYSGKLSTDFTGYTSNASSFIGYVMAKGADENRKDVTVIDQMTIASDSSIVGFFNGGQYNMPFEGLNTATDPNTFTYGNAPNHNKELVGGYFGSVTIGGITYTSTDYYNGFPHGE